MNYRKLALNTAALQDAIVEQNNSRILETLHTIESTITAAEPPPTVSVTSTTLNTTHNTYYLIPTPPHQYDHNNTIPGYSYLIDVTTGKVVAYSPTKFPTGVVYRTGGHSAILVQADEEGYPSI